MPEEPDGLPELPPPETGEKPAGTLDPFYDLSDAFLVLLGEETRQLALQLLRIPAGEDGLGSKEVQAREHPIVGDALDLKIGRYYVGGVTSGGIVIQGKGATTGRRLIPFEELISTGEEIRVQGAEYDRRRVWRLKVEKPLASFREA